MNSGDLKAIVQEKYGEAALRVGGGEDAGCCGTSCGCGSDVKDPSTDDVYDSVAISTLPEKAVLASLGCGNPTELADLAEGEVVLDLGSGGGIDVLLSAKRVGSTGKAYGLDMTDEMLELARRNAAAAGAENVEFLKGDIEQISLPDGSVDVIISNCVINLAADERKVFQEAYRVLKPGGRFAVSDVVVRRKMPEEVRRSMELWVGCVAGALEEKEFEQLLLEVGFAEPSLETIRRYEPSDARTFLENTGLDADELAETMGGRLTSAFVRARKPDATSEAGSAPEPSS